VAYYLDEEEEGEEQARCPQTRNHRPRNNKDSNEPTLVLIPQSSFQPYQQRTTTKKKNHCDNNVPSLATNNEDLSWAERNNMMSNDDERQQSVVPIQQHGKQWRPPFVPSARDNDDDRAVALLNDLLTPPDDILPNIGDRVQVFWAGDQTFYAGHVDAIRTQTTFHHIVYDDHDQEWLPLDERLFETLETLDDRRRNTTGMMMRKRAPKMTTPRTTKALSSSRTTKRPGPEHQGSVRLEKMSRRSVDQENGNGKRTGGGSDRPTEQRRTMVTASHHNGHQPKPRSRNGQQQSRLQQTGRSDNKTTTDRLIEKLELLMDTPASSDNDSIPIARIETLLSGDIRKKTQLPTHKHTRTQVVVLAVWPGFIFYFFLGSRIRFNMAKCCGTDTRVLAVIAPAAAVAGTPMPGKVKSPVNSRPFSGVLCPGSVCVPASARGLSCHVCVCMCAYVCVRDKIK
jgi:hypothetical protein